MGVSLAAATGGIRWAHARVREDEFDEDYGPDDPAHDPAPPYWFPGNADARETPSGSGLTHHVPDGALLDFAGKLDPTRLKHRVAAWVMLVVFCMPVFFYILRLVLEVLGQG